MNFWWFPNLHPYRVQKPHVMCQSTQSSCVSLFVCLPSKTHSVFFAKEVITQKMTLKDTDRDRDNYFTGNQKLETVWASFKYVACLSFWTYWECLTTLLRTTLNVAFFFLVYVWLLFIFKIVNCSTVSKCALSLNGYIGACPFFSCARS